MTAASLSDVFGPNALQDNGQLFVRKDALALKGLTIATNNNPEALLVAIILTAADKLTEISRSTDLVNRNVTVNYAGQDLVSQSGITYRRDAFSVLLYKQTNLIAVDPDDYQ